MANTKATKTSFTKTKQPAKRTPRGKSERTKILDSFKRLSRTEDEFYDLLTTKAFNPEDQFSFKELLSRLSPIPKATAPLVQFKVNSKDDPHKQAADVVTAISKGEIPADIGGLVIAAITNMLKIQEVTDIDERLKDMEAKLDAQE